MSESPADDRRFRVGISVDISSVNGAYGHLHLNDYSDPIELTPERMALLIVRANEMMASLRSEFAL